MRVRLPSTSIPILVLLAVGLLAAAPAAAADDGTLNGTTQGEALNETTKDVDSITDGNESNLSSGEGVPDPRTVTTERLNGSPDQNVANTLPQVASDALTEETLSDEGGHKVDKNHTREENDTTFSPFTGDVGEMATVFTSSQIVSYVESQTGLDLTPSEPTTEPEDLPATRAGESGDHDQSGPEDALARQSSGLPDPFLPGGLALSAGTGVILLAAVTRQSILSGLSAGPAFAAMAPVGLTNDAVDRVLRVFTPFRYSRFDDSDPLEHDRRREVFDVIEEKPGTYLSEVSEAADVPLSTARHHVRILEREDLVASAKVRGKRRFYPDGTEEVELAAAMDDEPTAAVLDALARLGPSSVATIADELGRDSSTVTHHLQRLDDDGLVERERDGRTVVNRLAPAARKVLEHEPVEAGATVVPADD